MLSTNSLYWRGTEERYRLIKKIKLFLALNNKELIDSKRLWIFIILNPILLIQKPFVFVEVKRNYSIVVQVKKKILKNTSPRIMDNSKKYLI